MLPGKDVKRMTKEELENEVLQWREVAPLIIDQLRELTRFRQYGASVEELDKSIVQMRDMWMGALELKQQQIDQLTEAFKQLRTDPLGVDRLSRDQPKTRKLH